MTVEDALESIHSYFAPLGELGFTRGGVNLLYTPKSPVLGVNCAYGYSGEADAFFVGKYAPALFLLGQPQEFELFGRGSRGSFTLEHRIQVGHYSAPRQAEPLPYFVEQVPWTRAGTAAEILALAWLDADWTESLTRHLSGALERNRDYLLLFAYPNGGEKPVGMGLVQLSSQIKVHFWGVLEGHTLALNALLDTSSTLLGTPTQVETSIPSSWNLKLEDALELSYWRG